MVRPYCKKSLYDLFYNDFLYDHSKGKVHIKVGEIEAVKLTATGFYNEEQLEQLKAKGIEIGDVIPTHADGSVRNIVVSVKGFSSYTPGKLIGPDGNEMDTEAFLASLKVITKQEIGATGDTEFACYKQFEEVRFRLVTQQYGKGIVDYKSATDAEGKLYIELDLAKPTVKGGVNIWGYIGIDPTIVTAANVADYFQVAWAQYDSLELETQRWWCHRPDWQPYGRGSVSKSYMAQGKQTLYRCAPYTQGELGKGHVARYQYHSFMELARLRGDVDGS